VREHIINDSLFRIKSLSHATLDKLGVSLSPQAKTPLFSLYFSENRSLGGENDRSADGFSSIRNQRSIPKSGTVRSDDQGESFIRFHPKIMLLLPEEKIRTLEEENEF
jgi:hypothetical protein